MALLNKLNQRIKFRTLIKEDAQKLFEIYSDKEAMKFRGSEPLETISDALKFIQSQNLDSDKSLTIRKGVELVDDQELIGSVMFRYHKQKQGECEIGYSIGRKYWGKGLGKAILHLILEDLKKDKQITSAIAWSKIENIASIKILEYSGFEFQGEEDEVYESRLYAIDLQ